MLQFPLYLAAKQAGSRLEDLSQVEATSLAVFLDVTGRGDENFWIQIRLGLSAGSRFFFKFNSDPESAWRVSSIYHQTFTKIWSWN